MHPEFFWTKQALSLPNAHVKDIERKKKMLAMCQLMLFTEQPHGRRPTGGSASTVCKSGFPRSIFVQIIKCICLSVQAPQAPRGWLGEDQRPPVCKSGFPRSLHHSLLGQEYHYHTHHPHRELLSPYLGWEHCHLRKILLFASLSQIGAWSKHPFYQETSDITVRIINYHW